MKATPSRGVSPLIPSQDQKRTLSGTAATLCHVHFRTADSHFLQPPHSPQEVNAGATVDCLCGDFRKSPHYINEQDMNIIEPFHCEFLVHAKSHEQKQLVASLRTGKIS